MGTSKGYLPPTEDVWSDTKRAITSMVKQNCSRNSIGKVMSRFSKAMRNNSYKNEGNKTIASSGKKIAGFSILVKENGLDNALKEIGLAHLRNKKSEEIYEGLLDFFSEKTNSLQQSIANQAMVEYMTETFKEVQTIEKFEDVFKQLEPQEFLMGYITKYIQVSFFTHFVEKISSLSKDISETLKIQKSITDFIKLEVRDRYYYDNLVNIDWRTRKGEKYIEKKCEEIWNIFESWRDSD